MNHYSRISVDKIPMKVLLGFKLGWAFCLFLFLLGTGNFTPVEAKDWDPRLAEASQLAYQGDTSRAQQVIEAYIQEHPLDPNGSYIQAVVLDWKAQLHGEDLQAANKKTLDILKKASLLSFHLWEKDPKNVDRLIDLGAGYLFLGRKYAELGEGFKTVLTAKKAPKHLEAALERDSSRTDAYFPLGAFHYFADNAPPGLRPFRAILGIKGTKAQGFAELKKALSSPHPYYYDTLYLLVFIQKEYEKNVTEGLRLLSEMDSSFPDNPELHRKRAQFAEIQGSSEGLREYLRFAQWCEGMQESCHRNYLFLAYFDAGRLAQALGQKQEAREYFSKAASLDTRLEPSLSAHTLLGLGQIEQADGKTALAIDQYYEAKSIPHLPKSLKKEAERRLDEVCKIQKVPKKC